MKTKEKRQEQDRLWFSMEPSLRLMMKETYYKLKAEGDTSWIPNAVEQWGIHNLESND